VKILVTGGHGFIGRYVQARAAELGIKALSYDIAKGDDILDRSRLLHAAVNLKPDAIIHLAGQLGTHELWDTTDLAIDVNIKGALNVAAAALQADAKLVTIEQPHIWYNVYEATKYAAKRMLTGLHYDRGLQVEFVTAHNAYGPGQAHGDGHPQKIIPTFATLAWQGKPLPVWGSGYQQVNLVYAGDVADMLVDRAIAPQADPHVEYNAGVTELKSVEWVTQVINAHTGNTADVDFKDMRRGEQTFPYPQPDDSYPYKFSYQKLLQTVDWYRP